MHRLRLKRILLSENKKRAWTALPWFTYWSAPEWIALFILMQLFQWKRIPKLQKPDEHGMIRSESRRRNENKIENLLRWEYKENVLPNLSLRAYSESVRGHVRWMTSRHPWTVKWQNGPIDMWHFIKWLNMGKLGKYSECYTLEIQ